MAAWRAVPCVLSVSGILTPCIQCFSTQFVRESFHLSAMLKMHVFMVYIEQITHKQASHLARNAVAAISIGTRSAERKA